MSEHLGTGRDKPDRRTAQDARRPDDTDDAVATGPALVGHLQRIAGNRAVAELLHRPRPPQQAPPQQAAVQREPGGWRPKDDPNQLHLDPQIEAQIRAINAMNAIMAPAHVLPRLIELNLPPMPPLIGPPALPTPQLSDPTAPTTTPRTGPAPGTGLMGPRDGTGGDIWKAVLAEPSLGPAITALGDQAVTRAKSEFATLSTGATVAVVSGSVAVAGGTMVGLLSRPDVRQWITATLNDKVIPVPLVPGLGVQLNLSGDTMIVGLHLDVGKILPAALGFGPASATVPLGAPPGAYDSVQRRAATESMVAESMPVAKHDHQHEHDHVPTGQVVQRDPIPDGIAGQTASRTGGAIGLQSIEGSSVLPAGKILSRGAAAVVKTTDPNTIRVQLSSSQVVFSMDYGAYIDAQWPAQNMRLFNVTHRFANNETTADLRTVDDEWGDGFIDVTATAEANIATTIGTIISRTAIDRARLRPPEPSLETRQPPGPQTAPTPPQGGAFGNLVLPTTRSRTRIRRRPCTLSSPTCRPCLRMDRATSAPPTSPTSPSARRLSSTTESRSSRTGPGFASPGHRSQLSDRQRRFGRRPQGGREGCRSDRRGCRCPGRPPLEHGDRGRQKVGSSWRRSTVSPSAKAR